MYPKLTIGGPSLMELRYVFRDNWTHSGQHGMSQKGHRQAGLDFDNRSGTIKGAKATFIGNAATWMRKPDSRTGEAPPPEPASDSPPTLRPVLAMDWNQCWHQWPAQR